MRQGAHVHEDSSHVTIPSEDSIAHTFTLSIYNIPTSNQGMAAAILYLAIYQIDASGFLLYLMMCGALALIKELH